MKCEIEINKHGKHCKHIDISDYKEKVHSLSRSINMSQKKISDIFFKKAPPSSSQNSSSNTSSEESKTCEPKPSTSFSENTSNNFASKDLKPQSK